jgi:hypothetical protein
MFRAISTTGRPTLLVRNNEVIGECRVCYMKGVEVAGIEMADDRAKVLVSSTEAAMLVNGTKYIRPRFNTALGVYLNSGFTGPESEEIDKIFQEVKIVDKQDFELGMCPDVFKDVPGYRKVFNDMEASAEEEKIVWDLHA